jgi:hypothetical protein
MSRDDTLHFLNSCLKTCRLKTLYESISICLDGENTALSNPVLTILLDDASKSCRSDP